MKTAEDMSTTLSDDSPSVDPTDAIADLLLGDDESEQEDADGEETQTDASTPGDDEESNDDEEAEDDGEGEGEETDLEAVADGDVTWEGVLGVSEASLSFDDAGNITGFKTKVNGEEEVVKAADLIAGYQNNKSATQKSQALSEEKREFGVLKEQVVQEYTSKLETVEALSKYFEKQFVSEYDNVDWDKLRNEDPAEYAAARSDYSTKANQMKSIMEAIQADKETATKEVATVNMTKASEYKKTQYNKMIENNPEWSDKDTLKTAHADFKGFVKDKYGFSEVEFDTVFDARLIELIKDAKKYHAGAAVAAKKRVIPVPKFQKSRGGPSKRKTTKLEKLTKAASAAKGDAKRDLQAGAVAELLLGAK